MLEGKVCSICKKYKLIVEFGFDKYSKDGRTYSCKKCRNKGNQKFYKSKEGLIFRIYKDQKKSCTKRNMNLPSYTLEQLRFWCLNQKLFHTLYDNWVENNYIKDLVPSIDRKNNKISYCLDNIQLLTWEDNFKKYMNNRERNKANTTCFQFKDDELIGIFRSQTEASEKTGTSQSKISEVINGNRGSANGFVWRDSTDLKFKIYTDGGYSQSKNIGGWAFIIVYNDKVLFKDYGVEKYSTNNKMELTALLESLSFFQESCEIYSDSQYVVKGFNEWCFNWKKRNWKKAGGSEVLNVEYWIEIDKLRRDNITLEWVKAHNVKSGTKDSYFNDIVDKLTRSYE